MSPGSIVANVIEVSECECHWCQRSRMPLRSISANVIGVSECECHRGQRSRMPLMSISANAVEVSECKCHRGRRVRMPLRSTSANALEVSECACCPADDALFQVSHVARPRFAATTASACRGDGYVTGTTTAETCPTNATAVSTHHARRLTPNWSQNTNWPFTV